MTRFLVRYLLGCGLVGCGLVANYGDRAFAAETFYCSDGRMLSITSANRVALAADPCVIAWYANNTPIEIKPQKRQFGGGVKPWKSGRGR